MSRTEAVADLRALLDVVADAERAIPFGAGTARLHHCVHADTDTAGIAEIQRIADALGAVVDEIPASGGFHYRAELRVGSATYTAVYISDTATAAYRAFMDTRDAWDEQHGRAVTATQSELAARRQARPHGGRP